MSWRRASELAEAWAEQFGQEAAAAGAPPELVAQLEAEQKATRVAWVKQRLRQEFQRFARLCKDQAAEDVTAAERWRR